MTLSPGTCLGPYEILAPIGAGGMGEVYRALDTRLRRAVAIKVLPAEVAADLDRLRRFEQEARAVAALNHPHILAIYDVGESTPSNPEPRIPNPEPVHYLVTELLEGQTLAARLAEGALPVAKAVDIGGQIVQALAAAHEKQIIHRDLKPANVFLTTAGHVKLLDFGIAKLVAPTDVDIEAPTVTARDATETGMRLGTVGYMAPEQVRGLAVDARADLFAFGAVLYEMLAGRRAFAGDTTADPTYAPAHAWLSLLTSQASMFGVGSLKDAAEDARAAASRAIELDESLAEAHGAAGNVAMLFDRDWARAQREYSRALVLFPNDGNVLGWHAFYLTIVERHDEAIVARRRALALDPLSTTARFGLAWSLYYAGRYDESIRLYLELIEREPTNSQWYMWLAGGYAAMHDIARTVEACGKALALAPEEPFILAFCAHNLAVSGKREDALSLLDRVTKLSAKTAVDPWNLAYIHAGLGNKARAVQYLERAIEERSANVQNPNIDFARTLGSDSRYQALVRKLNLPGKTKQ